MTQPESEPVGMVAALLQIQERFAPAPGEQQRKNLHSALVPAEVADKPEALTKLRGSDEAQEGISRPDDRGAQSVVDSCGTVQTLTPAQVLRLLELALSEGLEEDLSGVGESRPMELPCKHGDSAKADLMPSAHRLVQPDNASLPSDRPAQIPSAQEQDLEGGDAECDQNHTTIAAIVPTAWHGQQIGTSATEMGQVRSSSGAVQSNPASAPSLQEQARARAAIAILEAFCRGEDVYQRERRVMRPHQPWEYVAHPTFDFWDFEYKTEPRKS